MLFVSSISPDATQYQPVTRQPSFARIPWRLRKWVKNQAAQPGTNKALRDRAIFAAYQTCVAILNRRRQPDGLLTSAQVARAVRRYAEDSGLHIKTCRQHFAWLRQARCLQRVEGRARTWCLRAYLDIAFQKRKDSSFRGASKPPPSHDLARRRTTTFYEGRALRPPSEIPSAQAFLPSATRDRTQKLREMQRKRREEQRGGLRHDEGLPHIRDILAKLGVAPPEKALEPNSAVHLR